MGALAPVTPWIPEDDLALKNAIEGGASLPSLAKGAVNFSRRYTLKEIEDRWRCLLYDPVISDEASALMIEFEHSNCRSGRLENSRERTASRKRRISVRSCYYARRKRICTEALSPSHLDFVEGPGGNCCLNGNEPPEYHGLLGVGDPMGKHFPLPETGFTSLHHVLQHADNIDVPSHAFESGSQAQLGNLPVDAHNSCQEIPHILDHKMGLTGRCAADEGVGPSKELAMPNLFDDSGINVNPMNDDSGGMCPEFGENHVFNSPNSDFETSFHHLNYPSPPPVIPDWRNIEAIPPLSHIGDGSGLGENDFDTGDAFQIPNEGHHTGHMASDYNAVVHSETELMNHHIPCNDLKQSTSCETSDFVELSNLWGDCDIDDEDMFAGVDDCNLLLDSPGMNEDFCMDPDEDDLVKVTDTEEALLAPPETKIAIPSYPDSMQESDICMENDIGNTAMMSNAEEVRIPSSTPCVDPQFPEYRNGVICCTLNSEDPEIPCNDDIIFPPKLHPASTGHRRNNGEVGPLPSSSFKSVITPKETNENGCSVLSRELERFRQLHGDPLSNGTAMGMIDDGGKKRGNRYDDGDSMVSGKRGMASTSLIPKLEAANVGTSRKSKKIVDGLNHDVHPSGGNRIKQEGGQDTVAASKDERHGGQLALTENGGAEAEEESDNPEEVYSEDDDIPCYSDVESMILGMDLDPEDEDSCVTKEVAKYMEEVAQKMIVRLEQGANGSIQRAMACRGALAVLISHYSKYYIMKHKVELGRRTAGRIPHIDIDLRREVSANKISRRQATIELEEDGTFRLYNMGKASIYVNSKRVRRRYSITLNPNCLIEIKGVPFIFEVNQAYLKRYLDSVS